MSNNRLNSTLIILMIHLALIEFLLPEASGSNTFFIAVYFLIYALPSFFLATAIKNENEGYFRIKRLTFRDFYYISLYFLLFMLISPVLRLIFPNDIPNYNCSPFSLFTSGILAPILEEILWRGVVFEKLSKQSTAFAMIFSSLIFALLHENSAGLVYAFLGSMILTLLYIKSGSLLPGIILHLTNNLVATLSGVFPLILRILLTLTVTVVILANTSFRKYIKSDTNTEYIPLDRMIFTSPYIYLNLILVLLIRYFDLGGLT